MPVTKAAPNESAVLAKAVTRASEQLGFNQSELAQVIGLNRSTVSRMKSGRLGLPGGKERELGLLFVRIARALSTLTGSDEQVMRHFMRTENTATGGIPAQQMQTIMGLTAVLQYVDAMRGKL